MRVFFLLVFFGVLSFKPTLAQTTSQDSLNAIERQRIELRDQQARLKAKQDSLVNERLRIEQQQTLKKQQEVQKQQEQLYTPSQAPVIYTYQQPATNTVQKRDVKNIVGLVPIHMFITGIEVFYERAVSNKSSLQLNFGYHNMERYPDTQDNGTVNINSNDNSSSMKLGSAFLPDRNKVACSGFRVQLQYKSYIFQEAGVLKKLHIGPSLLYKQDEMTIMTNYISNPSVSYTPVYEQYFAQALTGAIDVGFNIHFLRYFSIDPFVGFSYSVPLTGKVESNKVHIDFLNPYKQGLLLRTGFTLGYTF